MNANTFRYCLHLADNALVLGQRNAEWTGHGPVLEQDIALTNISLDLLGQARNLYQYAASLYNGFNKAEQQELADLIPRPWKSYNRELQEDDLAYLRDERQFLNVLITELPIGDWAFSTLRQFFFSAFQQLQYQQLEKAADPHLAAIAEKSLKEVTYHLRWSGEWVIRLGDGTEESYSRISKALKALWPYTGELFSRAAYEPSTDRMPTLEAAWMEKIAHVFAEARLEVPAGDWHQTGGKEGRHTEHLGYLLAEMQYLQRTYPNATW
ncbi:MAG TPA: 1,2-phenylacetyl-CoA epoxidase subunit PaaC [Flavisolibacter sp.]|jgi:ring-1,2-phenylacetyl-CoA epoxidase subunit PaaC|nr:1,2-phenylacetyl-CoA epoxidase subunit PaaC [Flavisolibacter sp.]